MNESSGPTISIPMPDNSNTACTSTILITDVVVVLLLLLTTYIVLAKLKFKKLKLIRNIIIALAVLVIINIVIYGRIPFVGNLLGLGCL